MSTMLAKNTATKIDTRLSVAIAFLAVAGFFAVMSLPVVQLPVARNFDTTNFSLVDQWVSSNIVSTDSGAASAVWPIASSDVNIINSAFGPRLKAASNYRYDFHRGIDIIKPAGTSVKAIAAGKVYNVYSATDTTSAYYTDGGNTVVIEHTLPAGKYITFHGKQYSKYYSHYLHLQNYSVVKDQTVAQGAVIGRVGNTGTTELNHLHLEVRVATPCSYSYQEKYPEKLCSQVFGQNLASGLYYHYDPHVNPLLILNYNNTQNLSLAIVSSSPLNVKVSSPRAELDFNSIKVYKQGNLLSEVNLNERTNIDLNNVDNSTYNGVTISPARFNSSTAQYEVNFIFNNLSESGVDNIVAQDIWGRGVELKKK